MQNYANSPLALARISFGVQWPLTTDHTVCAGFIYYYYWFDEKGRLTDSLKENPFIIIEIWNAENAPRQSKVTELRTGHIMYDVRHMEATFRMLILVAFAFVIVCIEGAFSMSKYIVVPFQRGSVDRRKGIRISPSTLLLFNHVYLS